MKMSRRTKSEVAEQYVVTVNRWDFHWGFSIGDRERGSNWHRGNTTVTFHGEIRLPAPFKYPIAEITLNGETQISERKKIGYLSARDNLFTAFVIIPGDRLAIIAAVADRVRLITLSGTKLAYRKGTVMGLSIDTSFIPEEWF